MFQPNLLKGKRVLITGGGTGLGKSIGMRMLELGAELMICGRRAQVLEDTAKEFEDLFSARFELMSSTFARPKLLRA